ncbi:DUF72 domain-containing protein [Candidatus Bathyarchaeota archaeon]|nr:MAG: DUF72 domain-containing protein [Candidatus Bathyarchaeota archaeon]
MSGIHLKVGCCGFPVSKTKYYKEFSLVEINSTFYEYPKPSLLSKWKKEAPQNFEFTIKAHQNISHVYRFDLTPECIKALDLMVDACRTLNSKILLIQTPGSFKPNQTNLKKAQEFFKEAKKHKLTLVWETRGPEWLTEEAKDNLKSFFEKFGVVHCTDPFVASPIFVGEVAYFRLHGLGKKLYYYQYSEEELRKLLDILKKFNGKREIYVLFNNLAMFTDALRFQTLVKTGNVPSLTGCFGLESFKKIFEKTKFPVSKTKLIKMYGWKLFDLKPGKQVTLNSILEKIPDKTYSNLDVLVKEAKKFLDELD